MAANPYMTRAMRAKSQTFYDVIGNLGLRGSNQVCLDAGDSLSYPGVLSTTWFDRSGGSPSHFGFGASTAAPAFVGAPGACTAGEYFSLDGGDYFTYGASNAAWMETLHKDNAVYSWAIWAFFTDISTTVQALFGTDGASNSNVGMCVAVNTNGNILVQARNGTTTSLNLNISAVAATAGGWRYLAGSISEPTGNGGVLNRTNYVTNAAGDATYTSPSASSATFAMQIGAEGNATRIFRAGGRIAGVMIWNTALTLANLTDIFNATRGRFGV